MPQPPPVPKSTRKPRTTGLLGPIEKVDGRQFRAVKRQGRWPVGNVYVGVVEPEGDPCTIVFPDLVGGEVEAWLADMQGEMKQSRLLVGLPVLSYVYAGQTVDRRAFGVLPVISGRTLVDKVGADGPLGPVAALQVAVVLADALARLHSRGRLIGEIRPSSILLPGDRSESLRVVDLGIPRGLFKRTITPPTVDPIYTSAAVREGRLPRLADDIYALGAILFYVLTGQDPPTPTVAAPHVLPSRLVRLGPFGAFIDGLVSAAMAPPGGHGLNDRLPDMGKFARALRGLRDLHRLSPSAQQTILALRPEGRGKRPPPAPGVDPAAASIGFIETAHTRDDLPVLLSEEALESIEALSSGAEGKNSGRGSADTSVPSLEDPMGDLGQD
jgi:serine/threonine protein kinase